MKEQDMNDYIIEIARNIFEGNESGSLVSITTGKTRNSFSLWKYNLVDGWKFTFKFIKMLGINAVEGEYKDLARVVGLSSDWHTQASLGRQIMGEVQYMRNSSNCANNVFPFGKYKGQPIHECKDLKYLCWMANHSDKEVDPGEGIDQWLITAAHERALELGAISILNHVFDMNAEDRFTKNTMLINDMVENHKPISYVADSNNGGLWNLYVLELPTRTVGHPYYGECNCLVVDGRARKAKGYTICITDYEVEGYIIKVNNFYITK